MVLGVGSPFRIFCGRSSRLAVPFFRIYESILGLAEIFSEFSAPVNFFVDLGVGNSFSCFLRSTFGVVRIFSSFRAVVFGPGPGADVRTQEPGYAAWDE